MMRTPRQLATAQNQVSDTGFFFSIPDSSRSFVRNTGDTAFKRGEWVRLWWGSCLYFGREALQRATILLSYSIEVMFLAFGGRGSDPDHDCSLQNTNTKKIIQMHIFLFFLFIFSFLLVFVSTTANFFQGGGEHWKIGGHMPRGPHWLRHCGCVWTCLRIQTEDLAIGIREHDISGTVLGLFLVQNQWERRLKN